MARVVGVDLPRTGVALLDHDHQKIAELLGTLSEVLVDRRDTPGGILVFEAIKARARAHFALERLAHDLAQSVARPAMRWAHYDNVLDELEAMGRALQTGGYFDIPDLLITQLDHLFGLTIHEFCSAAETGRSA